MKTPRSPQREVAVGVLAALLLFTAGFFAIGAASTAAGETSPAAAPRQQPAAAAQQCGECHSDVVDGLAGRPHGDIERVGVTRSATVEHGCQACHGAGERHMASLDAADIYSFEERGPESVSRCQSCHQSQHPRFLASSHSRAGFDCVDCHGIHQDLGRSAEAAVVPESLEGRPSATCSGCHLESMSQFAFNEHHRLEEGTMECTSCHDPHEPSPRVLLGGFQQRQCTKCHTDKGGPFVFEHGAQRAEGCVACHAPHGSPNRHLLNFVSVAESCYSCHALVPGFHTRFDSETVCTNCHVTIHGSQLDPGFLK